VVGTVITLLFFVVPAHSLDQGVRPGKTLSRGRT
jgi:hypothetical protein